MIRICQRCRGQGHRRLMNGYVLRCPTCRGRGVLDRQTLPNMIRTMARRISR